MQEAWSKEQGMLLNQFHTHRRNRDWVACWDIVAKCRRLAADDSTYEPLSSYLSGILYNEEAHDWTKAEVALQRSSELKPPLWLRYRILIALGRTYDYQGLWSRAIDCYQAVIALPSNAACLRERTIAWHEMAVSYAKGFDKGDFAEDKLPLAIDCCHQALTLLATMPAADTSLLTLKSHILNTLGNLHRILGQLDKALRYFYDDLALCQQLNDRYGLALTLGNLGEIYQKVTPPAWQSARIVLCMALRLIRQFDEPLRAIDILANLGFYYQQQAAYTKARYYYRRVIDLLEALRTDATSETARAHFFATTSDIYANVILLCIEAGWLEEAFNYAEQARARTFLDVLSYGSAELAQNVAASPRPLTEIQSHLPQDALLLVYFTTGLIEAPTDPETNTQLPTRHRFPAEKIFLFAVTSKQNELPRRKRTGYR